MPCAENPDLEKLEKYKGRIIDVHAHLGPDQRFLMRGTSEEILEAYDRYGIRLGLVSSTISLLAGAPEGNHHIREAVARHPDRFLPLFSLNPLYGYELAEQLEREASLYVGVKFHPDYYHIQPSHPLSMPLLAKVAELGLPLMLHSYDGGLEAEKVARAFPEMTVVAYHMGGTKWRECLRRAQRHDNMLLEISSSVTERGMIEAAVEAVGSDRILFGTDVPYLDPAVSLGKVLGADINEHDVENILWRTAAKILKV